MTNITPVNETEILCRTVEALRAIPGATKLCICYEDDYEAALQIDADTPFEAIAEEAFACDSATLRLVLRIGDDGRPVRSMVWFIWSNGNDGLDCIADYGISLEEPLKPVMDWIEEQEMARG